MSAAHMPGIHPRSGEPCHLSDGCNGLGIHLKLPCCNPASTAAKRTSLVLQVWMYGLRLVAFNADVNIQRILGFRQLTPKEVEQLVKPEVRETK